MLCIGLHAAVVHFIEI